MANTNISSTYGLMFPDGTKQTTASNSLKNRIINGAMNINQRKKTVDAYAGPGVSANTVAYYYSYDGAYSGSGLPSATEFWTLDRWNGHASGYQSHYVKQVLKNNSSVQVPEFKYQMQIVATGSTMGAGSTFFLSQKIESIYTQDLVNKVVSLQANLSGNTALTQKVCWQVWCISSSPIVSGSPLNDGRPIRDYWGTDYINTGTYIYPSYAPYYSYLNNCTLLNQGFWTIDGIAKKYSDTFQLPDNVNIKNGVMIAFWPYVAANTANVQPWGRNVDFNSDDFRITGVQFELGNQATSFDYRPVGVEQELCERYCYSINNWSSFPSYESSSQGYVYEAGSIYSPFRYYDAGYRTYVTSLTSYLPTSPGVITRINPKVPMFKTPLTFYGESTYSGVRPFKHNVYRANTYGSPIYQSLVQYYIPTSVTYTYPISWGSYLWDYLSNITAPTTLTTNAYVAFSETTANAAAVLTYTSNNDMELITMTNASVNRQSSNGTTLGNLGYSTLPKTAYNLYGYATQIINFDGTTPYNFRNHGPGDMSVSIVTEII
jgi:hypothetical protein